MLKKQLPSVPETPPADAQSVTVISIEGRSPATSAFPNATSSSALVARILARSSMFLSESAILLYCM